MSSIDFNQGLEIAIGTRVHMAVNKAFMDQKAVPTMISGVKEMAKVLGVSTRTVKSYKAKGLIPYKQIGRKLFFEPDKVLKAMEVNHG